MSKIVNEYGNVDRYITERYRQELRKLTKKLDTMCAEWQLTGEEIRQLYYEAEQDLHVSGIETTMRWQLKKRNQSL